MWPIGRQAKTQKFSDLGRRREQGDRCPTRGRVSHLFPLPSTSACFSDSTIMAEPTKAETESVFKILKAQKANKVC
jgi:hypothetical protein